MNTGACERYGGTALPPWEGHVSKTSRPFLNVKSPSERPTRYLNPTARTNPSLEHHLPPTDVLFLRTGGAGSEGTQIVCQDLHARGWRRPVLGQPPEEARAQDPAPAAGVPLRASQPLWASGFPPVERRQKRAPTRALLGPARRHVQGTQGLLREHVGQSWGYGTVLPPVTRVCPQNTHQKRNLSSRVIIFN